MQRFIVVVSTQVKKYIQSINATFKLFLWNSHSDYTFWYQNKGGLIIIILFLIILFNLSNK